MTKTKVKMIQWFDEHFYKVTFEKDERQFSEYIPSVTTKLGALAKPFLLQWYGDLGTREANFRKLEQAQRGTRIHYAWQMFTSQGAVIYQPFERPQFSQQEIQNLERKYDGNLAILFNQEEMYGMTKLQKFYYELSPSEVISEKMVYDLENKDAGTADNIFEIKAGPYQINGKEPLVLPAGKYIIDVKTGNYIGKESKMQVSAYAKCANKMGLGPIVGALIVHTQSKIRSGIPGLSTTYLNPQDIDQEYDDYRKVSDIWLREFGSIKPAVFEIPTIISLNLN